jgi:hypothetical protein
VQKPSAGLPNYSNFVLLQQYLKSKIMDTVVKTPLNPVQLHILKTFSITKSEENLAELKELLLDFYQKNWTRKQTDFGRKAK